jgi:hypothetical protein
MPSRARKIEARGRHCLLDIDIEIAMRIAETVDLSINQSFTVEFAFGDLVV